LTSKKWHYWLPAGYGVSAMLLAVRVWQYRSVSSLNSLPLERFHKSYSVTGVSGISPVRRIAGGQRRV
jgi:hypothetical protein